MGWSSHPAHQSHWYDLQPKELLTDEALHLGLLMEIVAIRDIEEGEEITIDYGTEWSEAWDQYVQDWETRLSSGEISKEWPIRAVDLNEEYRGKVYSNVQDLKETPYPSNVMLKCFMEVAAGMSPEKVNGKPVREWAEPTHGVFDSDTLEDCFVIDYAKVEDGTSGPMPFNYTVTLGKDNQATVIKSVPHRAFVFVDKPGTGDQFVKEPFRHYIAIPDDVFPQGPWRDLVQA